MNLYKISYKNMIKDIQKHGIYFFTIVLSVVIFLIINSISGQTTFFHSIGIDIDTENTLGAITNVMSNIIAIVVIFLVMYSNKFFIGRKKKEIGIFNVLGVEPKTINKILFLEILFMGMYSLVIGIIIGIIGANISLIVTMSIYEATLDKFRIMIPIVAIIKTVVFFSIIYILLYYKNKISIKKSTVLELLYSSAQIEKSKIYTIKVLYKVILSIILIILSFISLITVNYFELNLRIVISILAAILGIYLLSVNLPILIVSKIKANKDIYLSGINVFIVNQTYSKINSLSRLIFLTFISLAISFMFAIIGLNFSMIHDGNKNKTIKYDATYEQIPDDFGLYLKSDKVFEERIINKKAFLENVKEYQEIAYYESDIPMGHIVDFKKLKATSDYKMNVMDLPMTIVKLSDFNKSLRMQGEEEITLKDSEYALISMDEMAYNLDDILKVKIKGKEYDLYNGKILSNQIRNWTEFKNIGTIILNDNQINNLKIVSVVFNINLKDENFDIESVIDVADAVVMKITKVESIAYYKETKLVFINLSICISIIFAITGTMILSMQQSSNIIESLDNYRSLFKIGISKKQINKSIFINQLISFIPSFVLAIMFAISIVVATNNNIIEVGEPNMMKAIIIGVSVITVIYNMYFIITYIYSKNYINKNIT